MKQANISGVIELTYTAMAHALPCIRNLPKQKNGPPMLSSEVTAEVKTQNQHTRNTTYLSVPTDI